MAETKTEPPKPEPPKSEPAKPAPPAKPRAHWFLHVKYWLWKAFVYAVLGLIYVVLIAEGLRMLAPALAQKLHKFLPFLGQYQETRKLDLAIPFALIIFVAASSCWEAILLVILSTEDAFKESGWRTDNYKRLVLVLGSVLLAADSALFYLSMVQMEWGSTKFSFTALLATAIYIVVLIFVSLVSVNLKKALK